MFDSMILVFEVDFEEMLAQVLPCASRNVNLFYFREEEGRDLLGKRTMDFKVSYLDAHLNSSYLNDPEFISTNSASSNNTSAPKNNRRYKTQLKEFLSTCRTKRKLSGEYINDPVFTPTMQYKQVPAPVLDPIYPVTNAVGEVAAFSS